MKFNTKIVPIVLIIIVGVAALMSLAYYFGVTQNPYEYNSVPAYKTGSKYTNVNTGLLLKTNIENYLATQGRDKPVINTDTVTCHANLLGYENNYAYARYDCTEVDASNKLVSASSAVPARFVYDSSYNITSYEEASDGEGYVASVKKLFPEKYYNLIITQPSTNSEESNTEVFNQQGGAIKSIKANGTNKWVFAVDLLTHNPDWEPGVNDPYLNQSTKIRNLNVTANTKTYGCESGPGGSGPNQAKIANTNTASFVSDIQNSITRAKGDIKNRIGGPIESMTDWVTYNFDIKGADITAIYTQCLP